MKQMTFKEIRDVLCAKGYSDDDAVEFVWDNIKYTHGRFLKFWVCELAYYNADLNEDHDCNDLFYFGSGYGSSDASRYPLDALAFFQERRFDYSQYRTMSYLVDQFNQLYPNDDCYWQDALEDC